MKIISLIKGSQLRRTNKEQNAIRRKLCFGPRAWRDLNDVVVHAKLAVPFWVFSALNTTMTSKMAAVCASARQAEQGPT
jgi:hypothetical protein